MTSPNFRPEDVKVGSRANTRRVVHLEQRVSVLEECVRKLVMISNPLALKDPDIDYHEPFKTLMKPELEKIHGKR